MSNFLSPTAIKSPLSRLTDFYAATKKTTPTDKASPGVTRDLVTTDVGSKHVVETTPSSKTTPSVGRAPRRGTKRKLTLTECGREEPAQKRIDLKDEGIKRKLALEDEPSPKSLGALMASSLGKVSELASKLRRPLSKPPETVGTAGSDALQERLDRLKSAIQSQELLPLPCKYCKLADAFHCTDAVIAMKNAKGEPLVFENIRPHVAKVLGRPFDKSVLGQILSVYPEAYVVRLAEVVQLGRTQMQLTVQLEPNVVLTSEVQLRRKSLFKAKLLDVVKKHHQTFLSSLKPPIAIPPGMLFRWHPRFSLENVPDIVPAPLPEPSKCAGTAKDALQKLKGKVDARVESALKQTADTFESNQAASPASNPLKGISSSLLNRIRAKEARKVLQEMSQRPEDRHARLLVERIPEVVRQMRSHFVDQQRVALRTESVVCQVAEHFRVPLSLQEAERIVEAITMLFPEFVTVVTLPRGSYLKIHKDADINVLLTKLGNTTKSQL